MRIGILGYGNLGAAVELMALDMEDIEVVGVFTRREGVRSREAAVYSVDELADFKENIDVLVVCYGSSHDLPANVPQLATIFNTVDTYDNHKEIEKYKRRVDKNARAGAHTSVISFGWDPIPLS